MIDQNEKLKVNILEIINSRLNKLSTLTRYSDKIFNQDEIKYIIQNTNFLNDKNTTFLERLYCIYFNINEHPKCHFCGKYVKFSQNFKTGYAKYCSSKCGNSSPEIIAKKKKTCIKNYGTTNPNQSKIIKDQIIKTNLERYGVKCTLQSEKSLEKIKATNKMTYGFENAVKSEIVQNKMRETNIKLYGVSNIAKLKIFKNKIKETNIKKYGTECCLQSKLINDKTIKTNLERYGMEIPAKNTAVKRKIKETLKKTNYNRIYNKLGLFQITPLFAFDQYATVSNINKYKFRCNICYNEFEDNLDCGKIPICRKCHPVNYTNSKGETEIIEYIKSLDIENIHTKTRNIIYNTKNNRSLELDVYLPEYKLAIEYNGIYWHRESIYKTSDYHQMKTILCQEKGIHLMHIWEDDWNNLIKRNIIKSIINYKLGKIKNTIHGRKTEIKIVSNVDTNEFLLFNHLQGYVGSSINIGLYFNEELVSIMTFGKPRFNKNYQYELLRFCNKIDTVVRGGSSKLFAYFVNNYKPISVISYASMDISNGELYKHLGFKYVNMAKPNYFYFKNNKRYSRIQFQKHKLANILEKYDSKLTESENMLLNGYIKIYDSGNLVFDYLQINF